MAKTLRILGETGFVTKNAELTFPELDQNFIELYQEIQGNSSAIATHTSEISDIQDQLNLGLYAVRGADKALTSAGTINNFNGAVLIDFGALCSPSLLGTTRIKILRDSRVRVGIRYAVQVAGLAVNQNERLYSYVKKFASDADLIGSILTESYHEQTFYDDDPVSKIVAYGFNVVGELTAGQEIAIYTYRGGSGTMTLNAANESIPDPDLGATIIPVAGSAIIIQTV